MEQLVLLVFQGKNFSPYFERKKEGKKTELFGQKGHLAVQIFILKNNHRLKTMEPPLKKDICYLR